MNAQVLTTTTRTSGCGCGCGCAGECKCPSRCCDLECLVRPNFFCGQMLTDTDLAALVDWSRKRFSLTRYREGWGIVCGLDVTCNAPGNAAGCCSDGGSGPHVYLHPGYAIDCCGNDLVVCEPTLVDLSSVCRPSDDPCQPTRPGAPPPARQENGEQDCWRSITEGLFAVDLTLCYGESLAQGQRAMFRSGCGEDGTCGYARVLETPAVKLTVTKVGDNEPVRDPQREWEEELQRDRAEVWGRIREATSAGIERILDYVRHHPPSKLCFIEYLLCCLRERGGRDEVKLLPSIRFWLYLDWLMQRLECPCWSCRDDEGVPLARVLMSRKVVAGKTVCRVVLIEGTPRYRRLLHKETCPPLRAGQLDLTRLVGAHRRDVEQQLSAHGVAIEVQELALEDEASHELVRAGRLTLEPGQNRQLRLMTAVDMFGQQRVVAFG